LFVRRQRAPTARSTHPIIRQITAPKVGQTTQHGTTRNAGRCRYRCYATPPGRQGFARHNKSSRPFIKKRGDCGKARLNGISVNHILKIQAADAKKYQYQDSYLAFLSPCRFFSIDSFVSSQALSARGFLFPPAAGRGDDNV
jgi:hypothetical protein